MDFATVIPEQGRFDWSLSRGQLETDDGLTTAVTLSLFTDRRAEETDQLPPGMQDRRGWWGDTYPEVTGDRIGSRLWLLSREKLTSSTLERARGYALEALQWLLNEGLVSRVEVNTSRLAREGLLLEVVLTRPTGRLQRLTFQAFWERTNGI